MKRIAHEKSNTHKQSGKRLIQLEYLGMTQVLTFDPILVLKDRWMSKGNIKLQFLNIEV